MNLPTLHMLKTTLALRTVLKGIPPILSPELLKILAQMGHGDELVIADVNFPAASVAKNSILVRADGELICIDGVYLCMCVCMYVCVNE